MEKMTRIKVRTVDNDFHFVETNLEQFEDSIRYAKDNEYVTDLEGWRISLTKIIKYKPNEDTRK